VKVNDRVQFSPEFLRNTGQVTGEPPPTHFGPFARGVVVDLPNGESFAASSELVKVLWEDGEKTWVNKRNLEVRRRR